MGTEGGHGFTHSTHTSVFVPLHVTPEKICYLRPRKSPLPRDIPSPGISYLPFHNCCDIFYCKGHLLVAVAR